VQTLRPSSFLRGGEQLHRPQSSLLPLAVSGFASECSTSVRVSLCAHCVLVLFVAVLGASGFCRSHRNGYWSPPSGSGSLLRAPLSTGFAGQVPREALVQFVSFLD
jgi:hypothetical protein